MTVDTLDVLEDQAQYLCCFFLLFHFLLYTYDRFWLWGACVCVYNGCDNLSWIIKKEMWNSLEFTEKSIWQAKYNLPYEPTASTAFLSFLSLRVCLRCHGHVLGQTGHNQPPFYSQDHGTLTTLQCYYVLFLSCMLFQNTILQNKSPYWYVPILIEYMHTEIIIELGN